MPTLTLHHNPKRRDSWPPTILHLREQEQVDHDLTDIDENPFSYFLTSQADLEALDSVDDDFFVFNPEDLSAGIESSSSKAQEVREISPSSLQRLARESEEDEIVELFQEMGMPISLSDFTTRYQNPKNSPPGLSTSPDFDYSNSPPEGLGLGIIIPERTSSSFSSSNRGRAPLRAQLPTGRGRGRKTRSLSARRSRSWREPIPELGSIAEERESDSDSASATQNAAETGTGTGTATSPHIDAGTQTQTQIRCLENVDKGEMETPKVKKRVHWAL
ncbi:hypothetical protein B7494_g5657 [Chlorociboria aeruginascens]|nr:hypothetical protein B7494_g5657 [Chlorociboria aeruginascens]